MRKMLVMALVMVPVAVLALTTPPAVKWSDDPVTTSIAPVLKNQDFDRVRVDTLVSYIRWLFEHKQALILSNEATAADPLFFFAYNDAESHISTAVFNASQMMDPASWVVQDIVEWTGAGTLRYVSPSAYYDGSVWYPQVVYNCSAPSAEFLVYEEGGAGAGIWTNPFDINGPVYDYYLPLTDASTEENVVYMDGQARDTAGDSHIFKSFSGLDGVMVDPPGEVMIWPADTTYGPDPVYGQGYENSQLVYHDGTMVIALGGYRSDDYTNPNNPLVPAFRSSLDGGLTWIQTVWLDKAMVPDMPGSIPGIQGHYSNSFFDLAFDDMGKMHFLAVIADSGWYGNDTSPIWGLYDIHHSGLGWTATQVTDGIYTGFNPRDLLGGDSYMHSPSLAWGEDGTLIAAWNDLAVYDATDSTAYIGIWASHSYDYGATWTDPEMVAGEIGVDEYFSRLVQKTFVPATGDMGYAYILTMPTGGADGPLDMIKYPYVKKPTSADMKPVVQKLDVLGPNPSQGTVTVALSLNAAGKVEAGIYNLSGQLVQTLHKGQMTAGAHELVWDGSNAAAGIYFARVTSGSQSMAAKVVLVK